MALMDTNEYNPRPKYMDLLPKIYSRPGNYDHPLIADYLKTFEKILTGEETQPEDNTLYRRKGLDQTLDVLAGIFYPRFSFIFDPENDEFIPPILDDDQENHETELNSYVGASYAEYSSDEDSPWQLEFNLWLDELLSWMSDRIDTPMNPNWDVDTKRYLIAYFMPFFRQRGTPANLQKLLQIFMGNGNPYTPLEKNSLIESISVYNIAQNYLPLTEAGFQEPIQPYRVGQNFLLTDKYEEGQPLLGGRRPYAYTVEIVFKQSDQDLIAPALAQFDEILVEEKPALGYCNIEVKVPFMVGPDSASKLGVNTYVIPSS